MAFPKRLLNRYETVRVDMHPHWWYLVGPSLALLASTVLAIYSVTRGDSTGARALKYAALVALGVSALWMIGRYLRWVTTNLVITSDRVIFRQGVLRKEGVQIPLERVNNVNFRQGLFERLLGAGDLLIESGGEDGQERFSQVRHPDVVTNIIHEAMEEFSRTSPTAESSRRDFDVADQLEKLEGLYRRGSLTAEEFAAQKRRLLG
jgi:uncharacterized membrane protein YdbT with pleckstrin-like domain